MRNDNVQFHLPTKPLSLVDSINRVAAAQGSVRYAQLCANADYNGHHIQVWFNDYRGYYIAEAFFGERIVYARGDLLHVLRAGVEEFKRQGRGASLSITVRPEDAQSARESGLGLVEGLEPKQLSSWYTWRHELVVEAYTWDKHFGCGTAALLCARDKADYEFLRSIKGREELARRKPLPEALAQP